MHLGIGGDDVAEQRLGALDVDGEIVVDEEDRNLAALAARPRFQEQQFVHDTFVRAKADGVAEEACYGTEFATVGAAAAVLHRNDLEGAPSRADFFEQGMKYLWTNDELLEVE